MIDAFKKIGIDIALIDKAYSVILLEGDSQGKGFAEEVEDFFEEDDEGKVGNGSKTKVIDLTVEEELDADKK